MAITGLQIHAARALAGWSRRELAARADLSTETVAVWERSSDSAVRTTYACLGRAIDALAAAGVSFTDDGVRKIQPPASTPTITLPSETSGAAA
jgi:transcriptional regulator with XRE-family HTH domain